MNMDWVFAGAGAEFLVTINLYHSEADTLPYQPKHHTLNQEAAMIKKFPGGFFAEAGEWARKRWWPLRLLLWLYFSYVFFNHLRDPFYQSWFKPINLGIHELGHVLFSMFGQFLAIAGGSIVQLLVPVISFFIFYRQRDFFAISVSAMWLSTNLFDVSTYMADARAMELPLVSPFGGDDVIHDWNFLLERMNLLKMDYLLAGMVKAFAVVSMVAGLSFAGWLLLKMIRDLGDAKI